MNTGFSSYLKKIPLPVEKEEADERVAKTTSVSVKTQQPSPYIVKLKRPNEQLLPDLKELLENTEKIGYSLFVECHPAERELIEDKESTDLEWIHKFFNLMFTFSLFEKFLATKRCLITPSVANVLLNCIEYKHESCVYAINQCVRKIRNLFLDYYHPNADPKPSESNTCDPRSWTAFFIKGSLDKNEGHDKATKREALEELGIGHPLNIRFCKVEGVQDLMNVGSFQYLRCSFLSTVKDMTKEEVESLPYGSSGLDFTTISVEEFVNFHVAPPFRGIIMEKIKSIFEKK